MLLIEARLWDPHKHSGNIWTSFSKLLSQNAEKDTQSLPREVYNVYPVSPPGTLRQREPESGSQGKCTRQEGNGKEKTGWRVGGKGKGILNAEVARCAEESTERLGHRLHALWVMTTGSDHFLYLSGKSHLCAELDTLLNHVTQKNLLFERLKILITIFSFS